MINPKLTYAKHQIDPVSGTLIHHFGEKSQFTVYIKRHNGRKKIVYMGNGNQIRSVLEFYNEYKLYLHDRKYLYHRLIDEPRDSEVKVLMASGSNKNRVPMDLVAGRKKINFKTGELSPIRHIPITILTELNQFLKKRYSINSQSLTKTRLISILFAQFLDLSEKEKLQTLARGDLLLERHILICGGLSEETLQKVDELEASEHGEDLL